MTKEQHNYLHMGQSVVLTLGKHESVWAEEPIVADCVERAKVIMDRILAEGKKQNENKTPNIIAERERKRDELEERLFVFCWRIGVFALRSNNNLLADKMRLTRTAISDMHMNDLQTFVQSVIEEAEKHLTELEPYKVTQTEIDTLRQLAAETQELYVDRKSTQDERSENTAHLVELFKELRTELKIMDRVVESYVTDEELLGAYFFSRRIHDVRSATQSKAASVATPSATPGVCPAQGGSVAGE